MTNLLYGSQYRKALEEQRNGEVGMKQALSVPLVCKFNVD
jgi:hypothetical protein